MENSCAVEREDLINDWGGRGGGIRERGPEGGPEGGRVRLELKCRHAIWDIRTRNPDYTCIVTITWTVTLSPWRLPARREEREHATRRDRVHTGEIIVKRAAAYSNYPLSLRE